MIRVMRQKKSKRQLIQICQTFLVMKQGVWMNIVTDPFSNYCKISPIQSHKRFAISQQFYYQTLNLLLVILKHVLQKMFFVCVKWSTEKLKYILRMSIHIYEIGESISDFEKNIFFKIHLILHLTHI